MADRRVSSTRMGKADKVRIRGFLESDLPAVRSLIHLTIDRCYSPVYPPRAVDFFKEFHSGDKILERHLAGEVVVAGTGSEVIGTGTLVGGEIFGVFIHPDRQRSGYGLAVMAELEMRARANGCAEVELSVSLPSRGFYRDLGYAVLEECSIDVGEGQRLDYWKATKRLAAPGDFPTALPRER